jgi:hypothetical protein
LRRPSLSVAIAFSTVVAVLCVFSPACRAQTATPSPTPTPVPPTTLVHLQADHIEFYYDRFLIEADGNVRIRASNGFTATGDAFSMDLKLNRYVLAGHVTMATSSARVSGAAIADFLDFDRIYFVPVTSAPDRWTFLNGDLAHPVKGRIMPGDSFYFPVINQSPSLTASSAVIGSKTYVRFSGVNAIFGGAAVPLGSYVINFSPNPYFAQNSLSGANFDATWNFAGSENALSALHLRYDTTNHTYLAYEQHLVGSHDYAIFSVNPLTKPGRFFNLQLYEKLGEKFQVQSFTQFYVYQRNLTLPEAATQTTYVNATYALPHSYLSGGATFTNYNILGPGVLINETLNPQNYSVTAGSLSHPSSAQIALASFQNRIGKLPLYEQIYGGWGFNHDSVGANQYLQGCTNSPACQTQYPISVPGLQAFGAPCPNQHVGSGATYLCPVYTTIWDAVVGFNLFASAVKFGNLDNPYDTYYFNANLNEQEQWNSLPHRIRTTAINASISRQFARQINAFVGYSINNTGDYYLSGGYAPCSPFFVEGVPPKTYAVPNPNCPESLTAFRGVATLRTASLGINYVPNPEFNFSVLARHHDDFPIPVPNIFPLPATNVLGQPLYSNYLGQPPNDLTGDVRAKILPHLGIELTRTYYFNFGSQRWSPSFIVQVLPF